MNAFYFVIDDGLADIAGAQAFHLAQLWDCDVHIFIERNNKGIYPREVQCNQRIYYHYDKLMSSLPSGLPVSQRWPHIVYLRLFAPDFLKQYNRVLYLDADVHSMKKAPEIWTIDLPHGLGAVSECALIGLQSLESLNRVGVHSGRYFNSGVILIDVQKWDTTDIPSKLIHYFKEYPNSSCFDQDFLNSILGGRWTELGPRFNYQARLFSVGLSRAISPVFVHFNSDEKPWYGWINDGVTTLDTRFIQLYKELLENIGVSPSLYKRPNSVSLFKSIKAATRRVRSRCGIASRKEKKSLLISKERRIAALQFFQKQQNEISIDTSVVDPIFFDGRYVRSQFHFADDNNLTDYQMNVGDN
ncbi:glycosyltransferase [Brucella gallinifaecis]|uniref:glycosyltransferase family 8 protein n=1 Tax=Brucella gallinifaecis TaxID=215590 RepID=UPI00235E52FD|nr:glycosyltransferase [Brucella gallinifaecis]